LENYTLKDKIIHFVQNASEDVNDRVAVFIAGMQAQKSLMNHRQKKDKCMPPKTEDGLPVVQSNVL